MKRALLIPLSLIALGTLVTAAILVSLQIQHTGVIVSYGLLWEVEGVAETSHDWGEFIWGDQKSYTGVLTNVGDIDLYVWWETVNPTGVTGWNLGLDISGANWPRGRLDYRLLTPGQAITVTLELTAPSTGSGSFAFDLVFHGEDSI